MRRLVSALRLMGDLDGRKGRIREERRNNRNDARQRPRHDPAPSAFSTGLDCNFDASAEDARHKEADLYRCLVAKGSSLMFEAQCLCSRVWGEMSKDPVFLKWRVTNLPPSLLVAVASPKQT